MTKNYIKRVVLVCMAIPLLTLLSCSSIPIEDLVWFVNNRQSFHHYDKKIEKLTFPDGKVADAYLFNKAIEGSAWYYTEWDTKGSVVYPVAQAVARNGGGTIDISLLSYYAIEDLGQLSKYAHEDFSAFGVLESTNGYYVLSIAPPGHFRNDISERTARKHKGQLVYKIAYVPKQAYEPVQPVVIPTSKKTTIDPSTIPNSDRQIIPAKPTNNGAYYYNANLAYQLQWLAVRIACIGTYDMAYTGDFRAKNPTDHYTTRFIKSYLAKSGQTTRGTLLFEGICFDYADFMYQEIKQNWHRYNNLGITQYWMVGTFADSNDIITYRVANSEEQSTMTINGIPVVVFAHNRIQAHNGATNHAWIWAQSYDGTMYWVDPTWTDNLGRPVYGVVRGGQEVQLTPSTDLCVR